MWRRLFKPDNCESEEVRRAREAAERAERERREVEAQAPVAKAIGAAVRAALERNHFGEQIDAAFARRRSAR
ncbi:hypothetical protein B7C42_01660 [Nocardia cerradoensis]|uniref:Uncharacterized protein n=1 Tax=Nocardia cerradoensis TaxID=85688 RepID=A0A231HD36_9NOCA|nr:hypothetical protein B7C42_01660 [Nocardia cerradoensis]